jgi:uncharacterized protein YbbK (DUF523 family)
MRILVSACLIGYNCKYNGSNNLNLKVKELISKHEVIPVCPEMLGNLSCPRIPCEKVGNKVMDKEGNDCTKQFIDGACKALNIAKENDIELAILQKRSPSCGLSVIYDGTFTGQLISGSGVFAEMLRSLNIPILEAESEN